LQLISRKGQTGENECRHWRGGGRAAAVLAGVMRGIGRMWVGFVSAMKTTILLSSSFCRGEGRWVSSGVVLLWVVGIEIVEVVV
jgi:hypothetical protein